VAEKMTLAKNRSAIAPALMKRAFRKIDLDIPILLLLKGIFEEFSK
jgi:hypothetical protein